MTHTFTGKVADVEKANTDGSDKGVTIYLADNKGTIAMIMPAGDAESYTVGQDVAIVVSVSPAAPKA